MPNCLFRQLLNLSGVMGYHQKEVARLKQTRKLIKAHRNEARSIMQEGVLSVTLHSATRQVVIPAGFLSLTIEEGFSELLSTVKQAIAYTKAQLRESKQHQAQNAQFVSDAKEAARNGRRPLAYPLA